MLYWGPRGRETPVTWLLGKAGLASLSHTPLWKFYFEGVGTKKRYSPTLKNNFTQLYSPNCSCTLPMLVRLGFISVGGSIVAWHLHKKSGKLDLFVSDQWFSFISLSFSDELEVEALFERELGKVYAEGNPEDDMVEKVRNEQLQQWSSPRPEQSPRQRNMACGSRPITLHTLALRM